MSGISLFDYPWGQNLGDTVQALVLSRYLKENFPHLSIKKIGRDFPCSEHLTYDFDDSGPSEKEKEILIKHQLLQCGWVTQNPIRYIYLTTHSRAAIGIHASTGWPYSYPKLTFRDFFESQTFRALFGQLQCVTTRDFSTQNFFSGLGVESTFSGCISSLAGNIDIPISVSRSDIVCIDVPEECLQHLARITVRDVSKYSNRIRGDLSENHRERLAGNLLSRIRSSELVLTTRLHVALPAISMGVPSILIIQDKDPRLDGLRSALNTVDPDVFTKMSLKELVNLANSRPIQQLKMMQENSSNAISSSLEGINELRGEIVFQPRILTLEILSEIIQEKKRIASFLTQEIQEVDASPSNFTGQRVQERKSIFSLIATLSRLIRVNHFR